MATKRRRERLRLSNICILVSLFWLLLALASALVLGAELMQPGMDVFPVTQLFWFNRVASFHGVVAGLSLPLSLVLGAGFAMLGERDRRRRIFLAAGATALAFSLLLPIVEVMSWNRGGLPPSASISGRTAFASGLLVLFVVGANAIAARSSRLNVWLYAGLGALAGLAALASAGLFARSFQNTGPLQGTYFETGQAHLVGTGTVLFGFAILTRWMEPYGRHPSAAVTLVHGLILAGSGAATAMAQVQLGLAGMPTGYADFPDAFADAHRLAVFAGLVFALAVFAGIARLTQLGRRVPSPLEDVFE